MQSCSTHDMCWPQQSTTANPGPKSHRASASWRFLGPTMWCRELKRHTVRVDSRCALVVESGTCQRARLERRIVKAESPNLLVKSITVGDSDRRGQRRSNWLAHPCPGPQDPADRNCASVPVRLGWVSPFVVPVLAVQHPFLLLPLDRRRPWCTSLCLVEQIRTGHAIYSVLGKLDLSSGLALGRCVPCKTSDSRDARGL